MFLSLVENKTRVKSRYQPDLDEMLSQCEMNYWLAKQLLPPLKHAKSKAVEPKETVCELKAKGVQLIFTLKEVARYTDTFNLVIKTPNLKAFRHASLIVRLYHDVKMLEVMEGSGPSAMQAVYTQDNRPSKSIDEKQQVNRFIGECLRACFDLVKVKSTEFKEL